MRIADFMVRSGIFLPMVIWGILLGLSVTGMIVDLTRAQSGFYCTVYCKASVGILLFGVLAVLMCQAKACWRK